MSQTARNFTRHMLIVLALIGLLACVLAATGCGAAQQHEDDKAQEARLAEMERINDRQRVIIEQLTIALARAHEEVRRAAEALRAH